MSTYLASLPKASFDGIQFPVKRYEVSGGIRKHTHEYPHTPGGALEKLGRSLYQFSFTAIFDVKLSGYGDNLLPGDLSDLRDRWEDQITSDLFVPHIGSIPCVCLKWRDVVEPNIQSGVVVELEFEEDQAQAYLINGLVQVTSTTLKSAGEQFDEQFAPLLAGGTVSATAPTRIVPPPAGTVPRATTVAQAYTQLRERDAVALNQIRSAYQKALMISEQPDRYADQVLRAADTLVTSCAQAYDRIQVLKNPLMYSRAWAFKRLWSSAQKLRDNVSQKTPRVLLFEAKTDTTITAVSRAIYGDTSYAGQIMRLNAIPDPFMIRKGSFLRYYDPSTMQSAA